MAGTGISCYSVSGELPLAVSPITLKMRRRPAPGVAQGRLPAQVDVRQMSLFAAGWTVGSLKYLSESGVYSATYFETSGWCGVMETEAGSPLPDKFRSLPGAVFPVYHVLADVGEFAGGKIIPCRSSDTLKAEGLAVEKEGRRRILLANLGPEPLRIVVRNLGGRVVWLRRLDETNVQAAMLAPETFRLQQGEALSTSTGTLELDLLPFAIARIDAVQSSLS
jgi:hypothetical protein